MSWRHPVDESADLYDRRKYWSRTFAPMPQIESKKNRIPMLNSQSRLCSLAITKLSSQSRR